MPTPSNSSTGPRRVSTHPAAPTDLTCAHFDAELDAALEDAQSIVAGLSDAQGRRRPAPESWSVAECLSHLAATNEIYLPTIVDAVRRGRAAGRPASRPFRPGIVGRLLVSTMEPPPRRPLRAPAAIRPRDDVPLATAMGAFTAAQDALRAEVAAALGLDLAAVRLRSPLFPLLRMSLGTCFALLAAHERRHLWQARRARDAVASRGA